MKGKAFTTEIEINGIEIKFQLDCDATTKMRETCVDVYHIQKGLVKNVAWADQIVMHLNVANSQFSHFGTKPLLAPLCQTQLVFLSRWNSSIAIRT